MAKQLTKAQLAQHFAFERALRAETIDEAERIMRDVIDHLEEWPKPGDTLCPWRKIWREIEADWEGIRSRTCD